MTFTRNVTLRALAEIVTKASSVLLMVVAARSLRADEYGEFSLAWATGWLAATGTDMGLHLVTARACAQGERGDGAWVRTALSAKLLLTAVVGCPITVIVVFTGVRNPVVFVGVVAAVVALSYVDFVQHVFRARGKFKRDAAVQVFARVAMVGLGLFGLYRLGQPGLSAMMFAGAVTGALVAVAAGRQELVSVPTDTARVRVWAILSSALPIGLGVLLSILCFRVDLYILDAIGGSADVGIYSAAYRIFEAAQLVPAVVLTVLFPRLAVSLESTPAGRSLRRRSFWGLVTLGMIVCLAGLLTAPVLVAVLFGQEYSRAVIPLYVLLVAVPFMYGNYLLTQDLVSAGRQRTYAVLAACALALNVSANLFAIPRYATLGAAAVTVLTEAALMLGCLTVIARFRNRLPDRLDEEPA